MPGLRLSSDSDVHRIRIDVAEPAAQPVVGGIVHDVEKRRRRDHQIDRFRVNRRRVCGRLREQLRPPPARGEALPCACVDVAQQLSRLSRDKGGNVPGRRRLIAARVDFDLRLDRDRLVGRHRVDRKKSPRVAGQTVDGNHAQPLVDAIDRARRLALQQIPAQRAQVPQRLGVIEDEQVVAHPSGARPRNLLQPRGNFGQRRRIEPRLKKDAAERVDVGRARNPTEQCGFQRRCAAAGKRIVDRRARSGQPLDEEARQLRLEAGAIRNLVKAVGGPLSLRPELVDQQRHNHGPSIHGRRRNVRLGPLALALKPAQLADERVGIVMNERCRRRL